MSVDGLINKDNMIYTVKYYLAMKKDFFFFPIFDNMDEPGECYTIRNKPDT